MGKDTGDDGYRGELGAAHVRIAQLEDQLAAREAADSPLVKRLESEQARLSADAPRKITIASLGIVALSFVLALPLVLIELRYEGIVSALIALVCMVGFGTLAGGLMRWAQRAQRRSALAIITEKLTEARRVQRLEAEVAALRAAGQERSKLRVGDEPAAIADDAPDALAEDARVRNARSI